MKLTRTTIIYFALAVLLRFPLFAQEDGGSSVANVADIAPPETPYRTGISIGIQGSLAGVGAHFGIAPAQWLQFRLAANHLQFEQTFEIVVDEQTLNATPDIQRTSAELHLELLPFKKSSFKLTMGAAYFLKNQFAVNGQYAGSEVYSIGEIQIMPEDLGDLTIQYEYAQIAPYAALGFGRTVPKKRVGFGFELGSYYIGSPSVTVVGTKMLSENSSQAETLEANSKDYKFYPNIQFKLGFRLN